MNWDSVLFAKNMQKIKVEIKKYINFQNNSLAPRYTFRTPIPVRFHFEIHE